MTKIKGFKGKAIYCPSGAAGEYSYWGCNFYVGCPCGCHYCYLKKGRGAKILGGNAPALKKCFKDDVSAIAIFEKELLKNLDELRRWGLFFSFTCDPLLRETISLTIQAIDACQRRGVPVKLLSKCAEGIKTIVSCSNQMEWDIQRIAIGTTLTGHDDMEPNASKNTLRLQALSLASWGRFPTFVSVEPIISFSSSYDMIEASVPFCSLFKIGLESGRTYKPSEIRAFMEKVHYLIHSRFRLLELEDCPKIYWKDGLLKKAGLKRDVLPEFCVNRDHNIFE